MTNAYRALLFLLFPALFLLCASEKLEAQRLFPEYVERGLDSALSAIYMTRYDLGMRWDAAGEDVHRYDEIKRMFGDPLHSFAVAESIAAVAASSYDTPTLIFRYLRSLMQLNEKFDRPKDFAVKDREIGIIGRFDINALDYVSALVLRRFLALAIATDVRIGSVRSQIDPEAMTRLISYTDSLLLHSEDDARTDLITMRHEERYALNRARQFFNVDAAPIDYSELLGPGAVLYTEALDYATKMAPETPGYRNKIKTSVWDTPLGLIAIGGGGDDVYTGEFFCVIDVGGNDVYRHSPRTAVSAADRSTALIVDFEGNDTYIGEDYAFGGTLFGASTLIDLKGNDQYSAENFSLGAGYFGVGILHDDEGSDRYSGGTCVQGAGMFGIGLIVDNDGNDAYDAHVQSQGFGYTRGFGGIFDRKGNDQYIASSPYQDYLRYEDHFETFCQGASLGYRPVASGGFGIIADSSGNDLYFADIYGQGTAYWYGLGAIVDGKGGDQYSAYQYSQGAGVHLAFGVLIDKNGNDNYISHGVSQGCGHDIAFGGLYDERGDDNYVVESLSLGGGNANAVSLFIDAGGADGYISRVDNTLGYHDLRRNYGLAGIFLDLDERDFYGTPRGANDSLWTGSTYGVGLDARFKPEEMKREEEKEKERSKEEIARELEKDVRRLFIQASAAPQKYQYLVLPAQDRLVEMGDESLPYLLSMLNTEHPREYNALYVILPRFGNRIVPMLIDTVMHGDRTRIGGALQILGLIKDTTAARAVATRLLDSTSWRIRSTAAEALLNLPAESIKPTLRRALSDTVDLVRARAARAYARVANPDELRELTRMFGDKSQIVRYQIQFGLRDRGFDDPVAREFLLGALTEDPYGYIYNVLYPLAREVKDAGTRGQIIAQMLSSSSAKVRADGVRLAIAWNDPPSLRQAAALRAQEKNSQVLYEVYRAVDMLKGS